MYKICSNRFCEKGREPQPIRSFSRRSGSARFKKDGVTPQYISQCHRCGIVAQNLRVKKKRAEAKAKKLELQKKKDELQGIKDQRKPRETATQRYCVDCSKKVSKYAARCAGCNTLYQLKDTKDRFEGKMDAKYTNPRGSKMRKKLGLPPIEYNTGRDFAATASA